MLNGEDYEVEKYSTALQLATSTIIKSQILSGFAFGLIWASFLWSYALGYWYGAKLITD